MPKHYFRLDFQQFIVQFKNSKLKTVKLGINSILLLLLCYQLVSNETVISLFSQYSRISYLFAHKSVNCFCEIFTGFTCAHEQW